MNMLHYLYMRDGANFNHVIHVIVTKYHVNKYECIHMDGYIQATLCYIMLHDVSSLMYCAIRTDLFL